MQSPRTKVVELDGSGNGSVTVEPCFYGGAFSPAGGAGPTVTNHGNSLGATFLTSGTLKVVQGKIDVSGDAHDEIVLLLFN